MNTAPEYLHTEVVDGFFEREVDLGTPDAPLHECFEKVSLRLAWVSDSHSAVGTYSDEELQAHFPVHFQHKRYVVPA